MSNASDNTSPEFEMSTIANSSLPRSPTSIGTNTTRLYTVGKPSLRIEVTGPHWSKWGVFFPIYSAIVGSTDNYGSDGAPRLLWVQVPYLNVLPQGKPFESTAPKLTPDHPARATMTRIARL